MRLHQGFSCKAHFLPDHSNAGGVAQSVAWVSQKGKGRKARGRGKQDIRSEGKKPFSRSVFKYMIRLCSRVGWWYAYNASP